MSNMLDVAWLGARRAPRRLAVAAVGVALSVGIMLLLAGIREGFDRRVTAVVDHTPADLWLTDPDVGAVAGGLIDPAPAGRLRQHPDVTAVHEMFEVPVMADLEGRKTPLIVYGYDVPGGVGGPWRLDAGRLPSAGEVVVDAIFARQNGLAVGDELSLLGRGFRIAGLSAETSSFMSSAVFADRAEVGRLIGAPDKATALLVRLRPGHDLERVKGELAALAPGLMVRTRAEVAANTLVSVGEFMDGPMNLLTGIAFVVGLLTAALMLYTATLEKQGEYQVLRALGGTPTYLVRAVLEEAAIVGLAGTVLGVLIALLAARAMAVSAPQYPAILTPLAVARVAPLVVLLAAGGALVPLRRVLRLDPAAALRG